MNLCPFWVSQHAAVTCIADEPPPCCSAATDVLCIGLQPLRHHLWHADVLKVMVWHTPKGIIDEGGKVLEGYVNFNITLMAPPEDDRMAVSGCPAFPHSPQLLLLPFHIQSALAVLCHGSSRLLHEAVPPKC